MPNVTLICYSLKAHARAAMLAQLAAWVRQYQLTENEAAILRAMIESPTSSYTFLNQDAALAKIELVLAREGYHYERD